MIEVLDAGLLTTVQDLGRSGFRDVGVASSGASDAGAMRIANALVGNGENAAVLELTLRGPRLRLEAPICMALAGASMAVHWKGNSAVPLPMGTRIELPPGELVFGGVNQGARTWMAVAGGFDVPGMMGSRSTDLRGGFGGHRLRKGDRLDVNAGSRSDSASIPHHASWWVDAVHHAEPAVLLRVVESFGPRSLDGAAFDVDSRCNRQGVRLIPRRSVAVGPVDGSGWSSPVAPGVIQCPPDGMPIILGVDAQTVGGYPRLGYVIERDLAKLAQLRGGERVQFQVISQTAADQLGIDHDAQTKRLLYAIADRLRT